MTHHTNGLTFTKTQEQLFAISRSLSLRLSLAPSLSQKSRGGWRISRKCQLISVALSAVAAAAGDGGARTAAEAGGRCSGEEKVNKKKANETWLPLKCMGLVNPVLLES